MTVMGAKRLCVENRASGPAETSTECHNEEGHCLAVHIGHEAVLADMAQPYEGFSD